MLIIQVLDLEDITPDDIDPAAPLFHEGLGLDSIDSLDIALALEQRYGVHGSGDPEENARHFASVRNLAALVSAKRSR
ncbi:MAG: phosphopantetheine-binding protein [Candidatus Rokuibacteriota bacterium]